MTLFINLVFAEMTTLRYNIIDMHCTVFQQDNKMAEQVRRVWADQEGNARARGKKEEWSRKQACEVGGKAKENYNAPYGSVIVVYW